MSDRLAIITHEYYPVLSGGTVFAEKMAEELGKLGWDVDILTTRIGHAYPSVEVSNGFTVRRYETARSSVGDATLREHLSYFCLGLPQMLAQARQQRYAAVFCVFAVPSGLIGVAISKALGVPSIVFVDAADTPGVESAMNSYVKHLERVFRFVVNASSAVVVLEGLEDLALPHITHDRVTTIPNGATIPVACARPGENGARLELLSIGRLVLRKGFQEIIQALGMVKQERGDFHLRVVGYGRAEDDIRRVLVQHDLADNISFLGRVEYKDIAPYYLGSDAYLFYGAREGSSLAMIEAAAYGLPLIASDHPGNRTFVEHGKSGFLVEHRAPAALADALLHLLHNRDALPRMGQRSREIAQGYSWAKIAARYDAVFRDVLSRKSR